MKQHRGVIDDLAEYNLFLLRSIYDAYGMSGKGDRVYRGLTRTDKTSKSL